MAKKDGRAIARSNEIRVLRALHRFGWLRTRDLAGLTWTRWLPKPQGPLNLAPASATDSALRMAQRTLKRLRIQRQVISAQAPDGSVIYALSEAGTRTLKAAGVDAASGKDLVRGFSAAYFRHRCIANEIAITGLAQGFRISTEREIAQGLWLGGEAGIFGKRPDVLLRDGKRVIFCEVEKSRKTVAEYRSLLTWLRTVLEHQRHPAKGGFLGPELEMEYVIFICTKAFQTRLQKDLTAQGWSAIEQKTLVKCSSELYIFKDILFP